MSTTHAVRQTPAPESDASFEVNNRSLPVIITLILLSFFFLGFFSIYFVRCVLSFFIRRGNATNNMRQAGSKTHGLDAAILSSFPTFVYSSVKDLRQDKGNILECAVCLSEFQDTDELRLITSCNHAFHLECIDLWLSSHTTCPVCRRNLDPTEEDSPEKAQEVRISVTEEEPNTGVEGNGDHRDDEQEEDNGSHRSSVHHHEPAMEEEARRSRHTDNGDDDHEGEKGDPDLEEGLGGHEAADRFSRCHSTGHSIIRRHDRYTLILPDHVKDRITRGHNSTGSCITFGEFSNGINHGAGKSGLGELSGFSGGDVSKV